MRFTLIDKILELTPGKSITAVKNVSLAEEYLADHFPGFPVLPGVLMVEAMTQTGAWLLRHDDGFAYSNVLLKQSKGVKFVNFVSPGNSLLVKMELKSQEGDQFTFQGSGTLGGQTAVSGRLILERFNLRDRNPELARIDAYQVEKAKELFAELWRPELEMVKPK